MLLFKMFCFRFTSSVSFKGSYTEVEPDFVEQIYCKYPQLLVGTPSLKEYSEKCQRSRSKSSENRRKTLSVVDFMNTMHGYLEFKGGLDPRVIFPENP